MSGTMPNESNVSCQSSRSMMKNVPTSVITELKMLVKPLL